MIEWGLPHLSNGNWILPVAHFRIILNFFFSYSTSKTYRLNLQNILYSKSDHFLALLLPSSSLAGILLTGLCTLAFALPSAFSQSSSQSDSLKIYAGHVHPLCSSPSSSYPLHSSQWPARPSMIWPLIVWSCLQQSSFIPL